MKNEKIKEFLTKLAQEEGFKVEFLKLKEKVEKKGFSKKDNEKLIAEYLLPWSKKLGYKLSKKDFIDFDRTQKPTEITGLSPVELENVSGGAWPMFLAIFAMIGGAFAGGASGGTTGNNAKTNNNFDSTDLTFSYSSPVTSNSSLDFSSYGSSDVNNKYLNSSSVVSSGNSYALTDDRDYLSSLNVTEGAENTNKANSTRTLTGNSYGFEPDDLLQDAPSNAPETTTTGGSNSGSGTTTTSASTPSSTGSSSVGALGYSQSSVGSGSVVSEQAQPGVPAPDFNITTGFAGGGTPADSPVLNQMNTTQGNSTFSATQNNTTSNTTSESFTSSSSQNGQSWKDFAKQAATGAAGIIAAVGVPTATAVRLSKLPDNAAQQNNTDKTKGTSKKTEDKKSTKETKKDGSDFMRDFKAVLNPLTIKYLDSLK